MKKKFLLILAFAFVGLIVSCGSNPQPPAEDLNAKLKEPGDVTGVPVKEDYTKGEGKFTAVTLTHPLDKKMIDGGQKIYSVKCGACHKLTDEKLVGPGWKGVTDRRTPEWIMNFVTNTNFMIDKDPAAQKLLAACLVRMPDQHLSDKDARDILEFMRNNDGKN